MKKIKIWALLGLSLLFLSSCSFPGLASNDNENTIGITGGITSETQILANLVSGMIKHYTDLDTTIINNLATTTINHQAMMNHDASISAARYTGTDLTTTLGLPAEKDPKKPSIPLNQNSKNATNKLGFLHTALTTPMFSWFVKILLKNTI